MNARERVAGGAVPVESLDVAAFTIPTEQPESDSTLSWDSTTLVVVEATAAGRTGLGYTYADPSVAPLVAGKLAGTVRGADATQVSALWNRMLRQVRNLGSTGLAMAAVSAVDCALWDLKARLLDVPLVVALDAVHDTVPVYGSGGFCSYTDAELQGQLAGWVADGLPRVKIKVGREPDRDRVRLAVARAAVGETTELYVDANGALGVAQALAWAQVYADAGVRWLEEPVSSDDLAGLRRVRDHGPPGLDVAAGEYGWNPWYFRAMLQAGAVDCLQADVTRCGGYTGFRAAAALADAFQVDVSAHCAPQLSAHACAAVRRLRHLEYFHDHVRIERLAFEGILEPQAGLLCPDRQRTGHGLTLRRADVDRYRVA